MIAALLAACGFHLRGQAQLPSSRCTSREQPARDRAQAQRRRGEQDASRGQAGRSAGRARLHEELRDKIILSFSAAGR